MAVWDGLRYFYGFIGGETDQWTPYLFQNNRQTFPSVNKPGYNLITDMADEGISYMTGLKAAAPDSPWFVYYVAGELIRRTREAEWVEKFKGKFDMGWNSMREQIFANQKQLGERIQTRRSDPKAVSADVPREWDHRRSSSAISVYEAGSEVPDDNKNTDGSGCGA